MKTGLVSITFRNLSPERIADIVAEAGLDGIEWGGDVHAPQGDTAAAKRIAALTQSRGLEVLAYGSYYRAVSDPEDPAYAEAEAVLDSADALGAPLVRIWAGTKPSSAADEGYRAMVTENAVRFAEAAKKRKMEVAFEYHGNTLTDTAESALRLMAETRGRNLYSLWQPPVDLTPAEALLGLKEILPYLRNIHVFNWDTRGTKYPLQDSIGRWCGFLAAADFAHKPYAALLEFVMGQTEAQFFEDAKALLAIKQLCGEEK